MLPPSAAVNSSAIFVFAGPPPWGGGEGAGGVGSWARRHLLLWVLQHLLLFLTFPHAGGYGFSQRWPSLRTVNPAIVRPRFPRCLLPGCWLSAIPIPRGWALSLTLCLHVQHRFSPAGGRLGGRGRAWKGYEDHGGALPTLPETHTFWRQLPPLSPAFQLNLLSRMRCPSPAPWAAAER